MSLYQISVNLEIITFWDQIYPKKYELQNFEKFQIRNKDIAMYPCTKFQSIWRTLVFGTKFVQKTP